MKKAYLFLLTAGCAVMSITVYAQELEGHIRAPELTSDVASLPDYQDGHIYLGGRLGWTAFQGACGEASLECNDDTFGYGLYGGYQWNTWFAVEGGVTAYGEPDASYNLGRSSADVTGAEVALKFNYPLTDQLAMYTRVGGAYQDIDKEVSNTDDNLRSHDWNAFAALGLSYRLSQRWSMRAEYQFVDGIGDADVQQADMHFTSLGLTYHFGQKPVERPAPIVTSAPVIAPPKPQRDSIVATPLSLNAQSLFVFDSAQIKDSSALDVLVEPLSRYVGGIHIVGHTDSAGPQAYNQKLSERRAKAVANYFKDKGIAESRLSIEGMGESSPIASNATQEGRAQNRRVEVLFETTLELHEHKKVKIPAGNK